MKTRFQYSRKRSFSPPGRSSAAPQSGRGRSTARCTGPQGPVGPACQKFSLRGQATIRSRGTPIATQASIASSSGPRPSSSSPSKTVTQIRSRSKPEAVERQLPGLLDRSLLEVVAEREVAEHLEERQVPRRRPDLLDVGRAEHLLARRQPRRRRLLEPEEVRLERLHAGDDEQRRGVERARHERRRRHAPVPARGEVAEERARGSRRRSSATDCRNSDDDVVAQQAPRPAPARRRANGSSSSRRVAVAASTARRRACDSAAARRRRRRRRGAGAGRAARRRVVASCRARPDGDGVGVGVGREHVQRLAVPPPRRDRGAGRRCRRGGRGGGRARGRGVDDVARARRAGRRGARGTPRGPCRRGSRGPASRAWRRRAARPRSASARTSGLVSSPSGKRIRAIEAGASAASM